LPRKSELAKEAFVGILRWSTFPAKNLSRRGVSGFVLAMRLSIARRRWMRRKVNLNPDNALELRYESLKYNKSAPYFQEALQRYGLRK